MYGAEIWGPILAAWIGGQFGGGGGDERHLPTADEAEMQSLITNMLKTQFEEYNQGYPLRSRITDTAQALMPKLDILGGNGIGGVDPDPNHGGVIGRRIPGQPPGPNTPIPEPGPRTPPEIIIPSTPKTPRMNDMASSASMSSPSSAAADPQLWQHLSQYLTRYGGRA